VETKIKVRYGTEDNVKHHCHEDFIFYHASLVLLAIEVKLILIQHPLLEPSCEPIDVLILLCFRH
jgi:hypothetical protein